jgi:hypothetical protein
MMQVLIIGLGKCPELVGVNVEVMASRIDSEITNYLHSRFEYAMKHTDIESDELMKLWNIIMGENV